MSFRLPTADHPARELIGDMATLAETLNPANAANLPAIWQACRSARDMFAADRSGAMSRINFVILRSDTGQRWLISIGRRGGWRKEWNFGTGRD